MGIEKFPEVIPWDKRIPSMAKEKVIEKIKSAGIAENIKTQALEAVEEIFNDENLLDAKQKNEWEKILATTDPEVRKPEVVEEEMAEIFAAIRIKDELKKRGINLII